MDIPIYYDPMISKMCTFGRNREEAIEKMKLAIDDYEIVGIETTLSFGKFVMNHDAFISGDYSTSFVNNYFTAESLQQNNTQETEEIAAIIASMIFNQTHEKNNLKISSNGSAKSAWKANRL